MYIPNRRIFLPRFIIWHHYLPTDWLKSSLKVSDGKEIEKFFGHFHPTKLIPLERGLKDLLRNVCVGLNGWAANELWPKIWTLGIDFNGFFGVHANRGRPCFGAELHRQLLLPSVWHVWAVCDENGDEKWSFNGRLWRSWRDRWRERRGEKKKMVSRAPETAFGQWEDRSPSLLIRALNFCFFKKTLFYLLKIVLFALVKVTTHTESPYKREISAYYFTHIINTKPSQIHHQHSVVAPSNNKT